VCTLTGLHRSVLYWIVLHCAVLARLVRCCPALRDLDLSDAVERPWTAADAGNTSMTLQVVLGFRSSFRSSVAFGSVDSAVLH
jgi:hypothetical protein